jgi:hypothetical protein
MGIPVRKSDFIRNGDGNLWIATKQLLAHLRCLENDVASSSLTDEENRYQKSAECLIAVGRKLTDLAAHQSFPLISTILGPEYEFSIAILLFALDGAMKRAHKRSCQRRKFDSYLLSEVSIMRLLRSRFTGSCPSLFDRLSKRLEFPGLYYASLLSAPPIEDHSECTKDGCIVERLDTKAYSTAYLQDGCYCEHVHIDFRELHSRVFFKMIPLVSLEFYRHGFQMRVTPFVNGTETPYVVISHV